MSGSMQKKGPELIIFPPMNTGFDGFWRKNLMWLQFLLIFFCCFSSMWAQISPDKTLQNAASNCEEMKGATASLAKTTVIFCLLVNFADFFLCTVYICRFFCFYIFQLSVLFYGFLVWCGPFLLWSLHVWLGACNRESPPKHDMTKSRSADIHQQRGCTGRGWNELLRSPAKGWDARTRWADVGWRVHGWNNHPVQTPSQRFPKASPRHKNTQKSPSKHHVFARGVSKKEENTNSCRPERFEYLWKLKLGNVSPWTFIEPPVTTDQTMGGQVKTHHHHQIVRCSKPKVFGAKDKWNIG